MSDHAEIELDPPGRPWAAQGDLPEFQDVVRVEEIAAGSLVGRAPNLAADLGKDGNGNEGILKPHDGPVPGLAHPGKPGEIMVGIKPGTVPPLARAGEDRNGIGV
jgi:hypothetical protein